MQLLSSIADLKDIVNKEYIDSILANYVLSANLGALATKDSLAFSDLTSRPSNLSDFTDDVVAGKYLSLGGGILTGVLTLDSSSDAYSFLRFTDRRIGSQGYADNILQITDAEGGIHGALGIYGNSNGVTYYYLSCENDTYNGNNFRVYADKVTFGDNTIYHAGNFNPADYLPKTGGTIEGTNGTPLVLNTTHTEVGLPFRVNNFTKAWIGWTPTHGAHLYTYTGGYALGIGEDGIAYFGKYSNKNTLLHSGNVGDYALKVDGSNSMGASAYIQWTTSEYTEDYSAYGEGFRILKSNVSSGNYRGGIHVGARYGWQLTREAGSGVMQVRFNEAGESTWESWKTIAFTDSDITGNAATATKLKNSVTLWGNAFDGSRDISGKIELGGYRLSFNEDTLNYYIGSNGTSVLTYNGYGGHKFCTIGNMQRMFINPSGNVTIGGSDLAGTNYKLYVDGDIGTSGEVFLNHNKAIRMKGSNGTDYNVLFTSGTDLNIGYDSPVIRFGGSKMFINSSGNVTIGPTDLARSDAKLYVNGPLSTPYYLSFRNASDSEFSYIGRGGSAATLTIMTYGAGNPLQLGTNSQTRMYINGDGNVTIGSSDLAGTSYALCVNGVNKFYDKDNTLKLYTKIKGCGVQIGRTTSAYTGGYNGGVTIGEDDSNLGFIAGAYNESTGSSKILFHYGGTNQNDASIFINGISGSVGIRKSNPAYLLEVNGTFGVASTSTFSGLTTHNSGISTPHITIGGITLSVVDGALKIDGNVFATGQLATGEAGHAASGGAGVQYWSNEYDMDIGTDILVSSKEYIGTNTIVGWESAGSHMSDLYIGFDGFTIWMQGSVDEASDMRLKTVIDAVNLDIRDIAYAPIFNYVFKSRPQGRQMLGSSAQYWQAIAPKAVSENDKGNLAMNYGAIALASVVAVAKKVVTHEEEIAELKSKVQSLETRLAKYELN